jgi:hypothetical protein
MAYLEKTRAFFQEKKDDEKFVASLTLDQMRTLSVLLDGADSFRLRRLVGMVDGAIRARYRR